MSDSGMNGAATQADEARKKKFRHEWEQTGGGHCVWPFTTPLKNTRNTWRSTQAKQRGPVARSAISTTSMRCSKNAYLLWRATNVIAKRRCGGTWKRRKAQPDASMNFLMASGAGPPE